MNSNPSDIEVHELYNEILSLKTVEEVHDFHCWSVAGDKHMMSIHVRSKFTDKVIRDINRICKSDKYGVYHTTI
jgi:zinc transporter 2